MSDDLYREQVEEGRRREQMSEGFWATIEENNACAAYTGTWGGRHCLRVTGHEGAHAYPGTNGDLALVWSEDADITKEEWQAIQAQTATPRHPASQKFHDLLTEIGALHDRKQRDYGNSTDPFANVRSSQDFGVPPWIGALIRLNDKVTRLKAFATRGELANESAEDSMLDIAVYALIALLLYREETGDA